MNQAHTSLPLPALNDAEGEAVPAGLDVIDAHVHFFPPRVFEAVWRWFETNGWPIRYQLQAEAALAYLLARGVRRVVGLHYSHVPGMAASLNAFAAEFARAHPEAWMLGTVLPSEPDAAAIVREALGPLGLRGIKLHCHVQRFAPDDPRLDGICREIAASGRPLLIHAGRAPSSPAYRLDTQALCSAAATRRLLERHPDLKVIVPHLGADEFAAYLGLLDEFPNLWLDTTMMFADYFPVGPDIPALLPRAGRLLYGSDFPNIPFAWDREMRRLAAIPFPPAARAALFGGNATALFG